MHLWLQLPDDLAYGRYTLVTGLFRYLQGERLPVSGGDAVAGDGIAASADFRYPLPPANVDTSGASSATFGDTLRFALMSADADGDPLSGETWDVPAGATIHLNTVWSALQRPAQDYSVFLHLTADDDQQPLAQSDVLIRADSAADYPTGVWRPGDQFTDTLALTLPGDLPPGQYDLVAGVYDWQTGDRLATGAGANVLPDNRIRLAHVQVTPP